MPIMDPTCWIAWRERRRVRTRERAWVGEMIPQASNEVARVLRYTVPVTPPTTEDADHNNIAAREGQGAVVGVTEQHLPANIA